MGRTTGLTGPNRRLYWLVAGVVLAGAVSVAVAAARVTGVAGDPVAHPPWPGIIAYTLLVAAGRQLSVRIRVRSTRHGVDWADAVILVGLAILPAAWVVLATAAGALLGKAVASRPLKTAFAAAKEPTLAAAGGLVLAVAGGTDRPLPSLLAWLVVTFAVMTLVDHLLALPVLAAASGTTVRERFRLNRDITGITLAGRLAVALLAVALLAREPQLAYALPLLVLLGHVWHEQWVRSREERAAWRQFAAATDGFAAANLTTVLHRAVTGGAGLFSADTCEVELHLASPQRLVRGEQDRVTFDGDPADAPPDPDRWCLPELRLRGAAGQPQLGLLRLRFGDQVRLSEREQAMLARYASALERAIRHACALRSAPTAE